MGVQRGGGNFSASIKYLHTVVYGRGRFERKLYKENLKRMHNICPTLASLSPSPTVTALSKEISLDYGRTG